MARLVEGVAEVCVTVAVVAVEDEPMAMIELDSAVQPHRVATGACDHDADKAHDRWDCPTCQRRDLWELLNTLLADTQVVITLNVLIDLYLQYLAGITTWAASHASDAEKRRLVYATLSVMQDMAALGVEPLADVLVRSERLHAPGSKAVN